MIIVVEAGFLGSDESECQYAVYLDPADLTTLVEGGRVTASVKLPPNMLVPPSHELRMAVVMR